MLSVNCVSIKAEKKIKYLQNTKWTKARNRVSGFLRTSQVRILKKKKKIRPWIKLGGLSGSCVIKCDLTIFIQMPWYKTHDLFFFSPGIWSSNSLGEPWQGCEARIYGSADGTRTVTFAPSGIFSSGKKHTRNTWLLTAPRPWAGHVEIPVAEWQALQNTDPWDAGQKAVKSPAALGSCPCLGCCPFSKICFPLI